MNAFIRLIFYLIIGTMKVNSEKLYRFIISNHATVTTIDSIIDSSVTREEIQFYKNYCRITCNQIIPEDEIRSKEKLNFQRIGYAELDYILGLYYSKIDLELAIIFNSKETNIQYEDGIIKIWYQYLQYWHLTLDNHKPIQDRIGILKQILNLDSDFHLARLDMCSEYLQLNEIDSASQTLHSMPELNKFEYYFLKGEVYFDQRMYSKAEEAYIRSIEIYPTTLALNALGFYYLNKSKDGNYIKAEKYLRLALDLDSSNFIAMEGLGIISVNKDDLGAAEDWFGKSVLVSQNELVTLDRMTWFYLVINHLKYAKEWIDELERLYPDSFEYHKNSLILNFLENSTHTKEFNNHLSAISKKFPDRKNELVDYLDAFGVPLDTIYNIR